MDALDLFCECCDFYSKQALSLAAAQESGRAAELARISESLKTIKTAKPRSLHEAIQLAWLYSVLCCALEYGRMDVYLGDFLAADLDNHVIDEQEALLMVKSLWKLIRSMNVDVDGRVVIGGKGRRNEQSADRFGLLAIEASRTVVDVLPQLTLRFYKGMNPNLVEQAFRSIGEGRTYPLLYNDDVNVPAVESAFKVETKVAEQYVPLGCGEYVLDHVSFDTPSNNINLLKALEITLRNGVDPVSGKQIGVPTGRFEDFRTFDELFEAWKKQMRHFIEAAADQQALQYKVVGEDMAFLYISALYDDCLERGKPHVRRRRSLPAGLPRMLRQHQHCGQPDGHQAARLREQVDHPARMLEILDRNFNGFEAEQRDHARLSEVRQRQ